MRDSIVTMIIVGVGVVVAAFTIPAAYLSGQSSVSDSEVFLKGKAEGLTIGKQEGEESGKKRIEAVLDAIYNAARKGDTINLGGLNLVATNADELGGAGDKARSAGLKGK
jgi:hypothetical protein